MIGIVGGMGPHAGLDLMRKILEQTAATGDQDHLPVALLSLPGSIEDRTAFLLGESDTNPADTIAEIIAKLANMGATVVGIPCNTSHAPPIFDVILAKLGEAAVSAKLVHMIREVADFIAAHHPDLKTVGVLSTTGTLKSGVYASALTSMGLQVVVPDEKAQGNLVQKALYDPDYGVKSQASPVTRRARDSLLQATSNLIRQGAQAVILGCTEIPLAIPETHRKDVPLIDPTLVLARALIRAYAPDRLRERGAS